MGSDFQVTAAATGFINSDFPGSHTKHWLLILLAVCAERLLAHNCIFFTPSKQITCHAGGYAQVSDGRDGDFL